MDAAELFFVIVPLRFRVTDWLDAAVVDAFTYSPGEVDKIYSNSCGILTIDVNQLILYILRGDT